MRPILTIILSLLALAALAQSEDLQPDQLDYYLQQALNAPSAEQRYALNHIGIQVVREAQGYRVSAVLEDYPAQQAGLYRGDLLLSADGEDFHPVYSFNQASQAPDRFQADSTAVQLTVRRGDNQLQLSVVPVFENLFDSYRSATVSSIQRFPSGNKTVGYLRLWVLSRNSNDLISYQRLFAELEGTDGLILDLRDCIGFLDREQLELVYRGASNLFSGFQDDSYDRSAPQSVHAYRNPIALLINNRTRGGAELFAYQLDRLTRVVTLGESTAGKIGTWQATDSGLHYAPSSTAIDGATFEGKGHTPENELPYPVSQAGRVDPQFQTAMDLLMGII